MIAFDPMACLGFLRGTPCPAGQCIDCDAERSQQEAADRKAEDQIREDKIS